MKEKIIAKMDEHIDRLLAKPELSNEEYGIIRDKLRDIKYAEEEAARKLEWEAKFKPMLEMAFNPSSFGGGGCVH